MNHYIKIKVKYLILSLIVVVLACGIHIFYIWCADHPEICISVGGGSAGRNLKIEAPYISFTGKNGIDSSASAELKLFMIHSTHEVVCSNLKDEYKASDIKLDIEEQDKQLLLKYHGTATTLDGKTVDFNREETVYFDLDAEITRHNSSS